MTEEEKKELLFKTIELDFDSIAKWTDKAHDDFPVYGVLSFLKSCGAYQIVFDNKDLFEEEGSFDTTFFVNTYTFMRIKNLIKYNWSVYSFMITDEGNFQWNTEKYEKGKKHYKKTLTSRMEAAINYNFREYRLGLDDDLPDNILEIRLPQKKEEVLNSNEVN